MAWRLHHWHHQLPADPGQSGRQPGAAWLRDGVQRLFTSTGQGQEQGPPAYIVIKAILQPTEMERFTAYAAKVSPMVIRYGGEYIVLGGKQEPLEDELGATRVVMHKRPN